MAGKFLTERDIQDLILTGAKSLELGPQDRITDLARERAVAAGLEIVRLPGPRVRATIGSAGRAETLGTDDSDLHTRIRKSVLAKLGEPVDGELLDHIIRRVLEQLGKP
jgi:hypothetical protein